MLPPSFFDTHAHINFAAFEQDWRAVLDDCCARGVAVTLVGSQLETSRRAVELAELYPNDPVYAAVGLHPVHVSDQPQAFAAPDYARLLASSKVVAVGETGVDYFRLPAGREADELARQREVFLEQLRLARQHQRALIMHTREHPTGPKAAYADLLSLLDQERPAGLPGGVIHCFLGTLAEAEAFIARGFYIGVTGIVTFGKKAEQLAAVVAALPLERLVGETDCPYLTPEPHRGSRNLPQYVEFVVQKIAELKGLSADAVAEALVKNSRALYRV